MRCKHDWEIIIDRILPSGAEQLKGVQLKADRIYENFFSETSVTILKCKLCGKLDKTIVPNYLPEGRELKLI